MKKYRVMTTGDVDYLHVLVPEYYRYKVGTAFELADNITPVSGIWHDSFEVAKEEMSHCDALCRGVDMEFEGEDTYYDFWLREYCIEECDLSDDGKLLSEPKRLEILGIPFCTGLSLTLIEPAVPCGGHPMTLYRHPTVDEVLSMPEETDSYLIPVVCDNWYQARVIGTDGRKYTAYWIILDDFDLNVHTEDSACFWSNPGLVVDEDGEICHEVINDVTGYSYEDYLQWKNRIENS